MNKEVKTMNIFYYIKSSILSLKYKFKKTFLILMSLTIGFTAFITVVGYVGYHFGYDKNIQDHDNIYRVVTNIYSSGELKISKPSCERALGSELKNTLPEVVESGYLVQTMHTHFKIEEDLYQNENMYHASKGIMDIFSVDLVLGNKKDVLTQPYKVLISEYSRKKYFGGEDPIGKTIELYPGWKYEIEGVYKDLPTQMHFNAELLLSFHDNMHLPPPLLQQWGETNFYTYIKMGKEIDLADFENKMNGIVLAHQKEYFHKNNLAHQYKLQPLTDIHLSSQLNNELQTNARGDYLLILLFVCILVVLAAGINYFYVASASSLDDSQKTGIRKIIGAGQKHLFLQASSSSICLNLVSFLLALLFSVVISEILTTRFNIELDLSLNNLILWMGVAIVLSLNILFGGIIPSLIINRKAGYGLLYLKQSPKNNRTPFRQVLVACQYVIVIGILISIISINKQIKYLQDKDSGLDVENKLVVKSPSNLRRNSRLINNLDAFETELARHPSISMVSTASMVPGNTVASNYSFYEQGTNKHGKAGIIISDKEFVDSYKIKILNGTNFYPNSKGCLINKQCLLELGYQDGDDVIGKSLTLVDEGKMFNSTWKVLGVIEDFNFQSIKNKTKSIIIVDWTGKMTWGNYVISLNSTDYASILPFVKEKFEATFKNYPFEYFILEDFYKSELKSEKNLQVLLKIFVIIGIIISMVNLFTMAWHNSLMRTKEIGIRKVNGAKIPEIITMLNKGFIKWVTIAFVIACPIAWFAMDKWLENFAYKTTLNWWIFILAGVLALGIALLTVSWQSWRAATRNPVEALRYE